MDSEKRNYIAYRHICEAGKSKANAARALIIGALLHHPSREVQPRTRGFTDRLCPSTGSGRFQSRAREIAVFLTASTWFPTF